MPFLCICSLATRKEDRCLEHFSCGLRGQWQWWKWCRPVLKSPFLLGITLGGWGCLNWFGIKIPHPCFISQPLVLSGVSTVGLAGRNYPAQAMQGKCRMYRNRRRCLCALAASGAGRRHTPAGLPAPVCRPAATKAPSARPCEEGGVSSPPGPGLSGRPPSPGWGSGAGGGRRGPCGRRAATGAERQRPVSGERGRAGMALSGAGGDELGRGPGTAPSGRVWRRCPAPSGSRGRAERLCLPARPHLPQPLRRRGAEPLLPGAQRLEEGPRPPHWRAGEVGDREVWKNPGVRQHTAWVVNAALCRRRVFHVPP